MGRPLRIEYPGAVHYISLYGADEREIFIDAEDRIRFLEILEQTITRYSWVCHGYCLLNDHYHLIIETPTPNLSLGMRQVNGIYTQYFNRYHNTKGALFKGRFKSILIEKEKYLLEIARHLSFNPMRLGLVKRIKDWQWSSYPVFAGVIQKSHFVHTNYILDDLGKKKKAHKSFRKYVKSGDKAIPPLVFVQSQLYLGSDSFIKSVQKRHLTTKNDSVILNGKRPTLAELFKKSDNRDKRDKIIKKAHIQHNYLLKEIAVFLGLHHTTVSKIINR